MTSLGVKKKKAVLSLLLIHEVEEATHTLIMRPHHGGEVVSYPTTSFMGYICVCEVTLSVLLLVPDFRARRGGGGGGGGERGNPLLLFGLIS